MAIVSTVGLEHAGFDPSLIAGYSAAVNAAWAQFLTEYLHFRAKAMTFWLGLKHPAASTTVSVAVGMDANYGRVEGDAPHDVEVRLLHHLRDRLGQ